MGTYAIRSIVLKVPHRLLLLGLTSSSVWAEVVVEPAQPITHRVQVQPILVKKTNGSVANTFGDATTEAYIKLQINRIYAQIGVRIDWLPMNEYINDFAYDGSPGNYTSNERPTGDLNTIVSSAPIPPKNNNAIIPNMFFVKIPPAFHQEAENAANGYAFIDSNGSTMHVGSDLLIWGESANDVIARVIAHELGHNLGLSHYTADSANLMYGTGGSTGRLLSSQKTIVFTNHLGTDGFDFLQPVPPPTNYSTWASTNNVTGGPGGDDDLDGVKNLIEFMFQTNPKQSSGLPQPVAAANGLTWTLPKHAPAVADGIVYRVTTSETLTSWLPAGSDSGRSTVLQNDASALVVRLLSGGSKRFMRLDIDIPVAVGGDAASFIPHQTPSTPPVHAYPGDIMYFPPP